MTIRVVVVLSDASKTGKDQSRQWWWPDLVVCTYSAMGLSCRCLWSGRVLFHIYLLQEPGAAVRTKANHRHTNSYQ